MVWNVDANDTSRRNLGPEPPGVTGRTAIGCNAVAVIRARMEARQARLERGAAAFDRVIFDDE
jgi:hypothetical protein